MQRLEGNLRSIYRVVKSPPHEDLQLNSNFSSTTITVSKNVWKRILPSDKAESTAKVPPKVAKALVNTHNLFLSRLHEVEGDFENYKTYLTRCGKGYSPKESEREACLTSRRNITAWNRATSAFVKLMQSQDYPKLENLLKSAFPRLQNPDLLQLFAPVQAVEIAKAQKVIDLEGVTAGPLPLSIFKKIMKEKPLNALEEKEVGKWAQKVNRSQVKLKHLHRALDYLAKFYGKESKTHFLESSLQDHGLTIFQQEDPKHMKWVSGIKSGTKVRMKDREIILGEEIHPKHLRRQKTHVYHIEGEPGHVAVISCNSEILILRDLKMHETRQVLKPVLILEVSEDRKVVIMEKCEALSSLKWTSSAEGISLQDAPTLSLIAAFLAKLVHEKQTPMHFSPDYLMLDGQGELKILKPGIRGDFDFTAIEEFILNCSSGNASVFQYLMAESGLTKHPAAHFYEDLIQTALKEENISAEDLAAIHLITDPKIVDNATALIDQITALKKTVLSQLFDAFPQKDPKSIGKSVNESIISIQKAKKCCGILWPSIAQEILSAFNVPL